MKSRLLAVSLLLLWGVNGMAQRAETEWADPHPASSAAWQDMKQPQLGWGTTNERYPLNAVPRTDKQLRLYAWRGERVAAQALLLAPNDIASMHVEVSDLICGKKVIPQQCVRKYYAYYAMADAFRNKSGKSGGLRNKADFDSSLVADRLSPVEPIKVSARSLRPIWLDIRVPQDAAPGVYKGWLKAQCDGQWTQIPLSVEVGRRTLPQPKDWYFHLDLWQNPYAVARYYGVPLWSKEHFDIMRPLMQLLADAGQKVITCSIIQHPWNSQTEDPFESMIGKTKKLDGTWAYNYEVFDRWVQFMMSVGIDRQIDCYTMVPWHLKFEYFDEATNCTQIVNAKPGEQAYEDYLLPFLRDFARHLKAKGWFERTCISMDERPMDLLRAAWTVLRKADPDFKIEGACDYYPEQVQGNLHDLSIGYQHGLLSKEILEARRQAGRKTTLYTCCGPERPNTFTFSPPAESAAIGWSIAAADYDGYLRWAYNSWVKNPCQDGRFRTWPSGDCFLVYPGGSSIRMEKLVQGIQAYEKIRLLKKELSGKQLVRLQEAVDTFHPNVFKKEVDAASLLEKAEATLRELSK